MNVGDNIFNFLILIIGINVLHVVESFMNICDNNVTQKLFVSYYVIL